MSVNLSFCYFEPTEPVAKVGYFWELLKTSVFRSFPLKAAYLVPLGAKLQGISKSLFKI
jgi:hypothetical protein